MTIKELFRTHDSSSNRITKQQLSFHTGLDERVVRQRIHNNRVNGELIISHSKSKGFFRWDNPTDWNDLQEAKMMRNELMSRISNLFKILKPINKAIADSTDKMRGLAQQKLFTDPVDDACPF